MYTPFDLSGRTAIVTGGSKGIGLACAQGFLAEGARVTLVARNPQTLAQELLQLDGEVSVYITHPKPGEVPAVLSQIRALDTRHVIEPLREGQRFHAPVVDRRQM